MRKFLFSLFKFVINEHQVNLWVCNYEYAQNMSQGLEMMEILLISYRLFKKNCSIVVQELTVMC